MPELGMMNEKLGSES